MGIKYGNTDLPHINYGNTPITKVCYGNQQIRPSAVPPAPFVPGENTIFYFPFESDADDHSGNNYVLTDSGTQLTVGRQFDTTVYLDRNIPFGENFSCVWMKINTRGNRPNDNANIGFFCNGYLQYKVNDQRGDTDNFIYYDEYLIGQKLWAGFNEGEWNFIGGSYQIINGIVVAKVYMNSSHQYLSNLNPFTGWGTSTNEFFVDRVDDPAIITLSDYILENRVWTDPEVLAYYNATKSKYGIS